MLRDGVWVPWSGGGPLPAVFTEPDPVLAGAPAWRTASPGVEVGELSLRGRRGLWTLRVVLVRVDPAVVTFRVVVPPRRDDGFSGRWSVDEAPSDALVAVNAGQFTGGPWGWLVQRGSVLQPPGSGALAPGFAVRDDGTLALLPPDSLVGAVGVTEGFQSYPALISGDGVVPAPLRTPGGGVDLAHRDGRFALGVLRDGRLLFALTRLAGLGGLMEVVPFGPTTPEMAALMGGMGCRRAVLLDGGISGQMMVLDGRERRLWPGLRKVAAGLLVLSGEGTPPPFTLP